MKGERKGLFERNLKLLKPLDKTLWERIKRVEYPDDYEVFPSRSGPPTLRVEGKLFHSSYDPVGEGKRWVERHLDGWDGISTPLVFGLGLGYHLIELTSLLEGNILVVEPDIKVFRIALEYIDLSKFISRVGFLVAPDEEKFKGMRDNFYMMPFQPSVSFYKDLYKIIKRRIKLSERFRILVVGPVYGGSLPIVRYSSASMRRMGYDVEVMDCSLFKEAYHAISGIAPDEENESKLRGLFITFLSEMVMAKVVDFKPDLIFALAQAPITRSLLERFRGYSIPTAFWFVEDFMTLDYWKDVAPLYDYFFTIQDGPFFNLLKDLGVRNYHYLPLAASPEIHRPLELSKAEMEEFGSDLSFVGAGYFNRRNFLLSLVDFDLKIWGNDWTGVASLQKSIQRGGARISTEECVKVFNASKINLNLHSSKRHEGVNPYGDFVNPRTFEISACGGFQLVDYRSHLPRFFETGSEIIFFKDIGDLRKKIGYYLSHNDEMTEIAERARKRVLKEHTYDERIEEMMSFIVERGFDGVRSIPGRAMVKDLIRDSGIDTELGRFFSRFRGMRSLTLSDIVMEIRGGRGDLTRPEAILLMMNEIFHKK